MYQGAICTAKKNKAGEGTPRGEGAILNRVVREDPSYPMIKIRSKLASESWRKGHSRQKEQLRRRPGGRYVKNFKETGVWNGW